jgi:RNA 3'-terminal phosphate cyclase (ATP)
VKLPTCLLITLIYRLNMITINGGAKSGSGTIVRYSVALASLLGEEIKLENIRAGRDKPGLRAQHLKVVQACREMCYGVVKNATVGSKEITYTPGGRFNGGEYSWDIGTAGSTTMMAQTLLPLACFARKPSKFRLEGGLFQDFAPSAYHMKFVLLPFLKKIGVRVEFDIMRPGYVPRGGGIIEVRVEPTGKLKPLNLTEQGEVFSIKGMALSSHLKEKRVSKRMAGECQRLLNSYGYKAEIEEIEDESSLQEGAALAIYAETSSGNRMGSDRAGRPGRSSESIGRYVAERFVEDVKTGAAVDRYIADQLIIYAGLAEGVTRYSVPRITEHVETNLWLIEEFLGARTKIDGNFLEIKGVSFA